MRLLERLNRQSSVRSAAVLISGAFLLSKVLGLYRDRLISSNFGISGQVDAYTAAFRLPDLVFQILISGAFAVAFMPLFMNYWNEDKREQAWQFANSILNAIIFFTITTSVVAYIWASPIITMMAPGFDAARHDLTVQLTRVMLITPIMFGVSSIFGSIEQSFNRFVLFSLASTLYNIGTIFGIIFLAPHFGIFGVAYGVVIGATVQALTQVFGVWGLGYRPAIVSFWNASFRKFVKQVIPRSIDLGLEQVNWIVQTIIGSTLAPGSLAALYFANNLRNVPVGLFGAAIATAAFPTLIQKAKEPKELIAQFATHLRMIMFFVVPASAIAILMRGYIVRLILGFGDQLTSDTLGSLSVSIFALSLFVLVTRIYYALGDTWTPLWTSLISIVINAVSAFFLVKIWGAVGLGSALSIATVVELGLLLYLLKRRLGSIGGCTVVEGTIKIVIATLLMSLPVYLAVRYAFPLYAEDRGFNVVGPKFAAIGLIGLLSYYLFARLLGLSEATRTYQVGLSYVRQLLSRRKTNL